MGTPCFGSSSWPALLVPLCLPPVTCRPTDAALPFLLRAAVTPLWLPGCSWLAGAVVSAVGLPSPAAGPLLGPLF